MQGLRGVAAIGLTLCAVLIMVSCIGIGKAPKVPPPAAGAAPAVALPAPPPPLPPFVAQISLTTSADVNPDASASPSPIVVRIYQLKDDAAFSAAEFSPLFDDDQKVLAASLINRREIVMAPGKQQTISLEISTDAKFVGVVGAFRDVRNARWRAIVPAGRQNLTITIDRLRVALSPAGS